MAISKVEYIGRVLIDLTQDTVSENNLLSGVVAHDATGRQITGALENVGDGKYIWAKHIGKVWDITTTELGTTGPSDSSSYSYGYETNKSYFYTSRQDEFIMEGMDGAKVKVRAYGENDTFGVWSEKKEVSGVDSTGGVEVHTVDIPYQGKTERSYFYAQN